MKLETGHIFSFQTPSSTRETTRGEETDNRRGKNGTDKKKQREKKEEARENCVAYEREEETQR